MLANIFTVFGFSHLCSIFMVDYWWWKIFIKVAYFLLNISCKLCCTFVLGFQKLDFSLYPDRECQLRWLRNFLEFSYSENGQNALSVTDKDVERLFVQVNKFALVSCFFLHHLRCTSNYSILFILSTVSVSAAFSCEEICSQLMLSFCFIDSTFIQTSVVYHDIWEWIHLSTTDISFTWAIFLKIKIWWTVTNEFCTLPGVSSFFQFLLCTGNTLQQSRCTVV